MRVLIPTLGSIGDLMPFLAVAQALRERRHEVIIASHAGYAPLVQRAGFGFGVIWDAMPAPLDDLLEQAPDQAWARIHGELFGAAAAPTAAFIRHAGAVFLGRHTPEAFGDYCAGPNHVLPTSRAARFSNPLGVYEFQKRSSLIDCTPDGARVLAGIAGRIADAEGLQAHAASARDRG